MEPVLFRIGEVAAFFNVSVKAMRIYEKMGILRPVKLHELTEEERAQLLCKFSCLDLNLHELHGRNVLSEALWL